MDHKSRRIGLFVETYVVTFKLVPEGQTWGYRKLPGTYFAALCQVTRDGKVFGASQEAHYFKDEGNRDRYVTRRIQEAKARYLEVGAQEAPAFGYLDETDPLQEKQS